MGEYRIVVPAIQGDDVPRPKPHDLGQKVKAALACGAFVAFLGMILVSAATLPGGFLSEWLWGIAASFVVGAIVTCCCGFFWARNVASREWRLEDATRKQQQKKEQQAMAAEMAAIEKARQGTPDAGGAPTARGNRLHAVAMQWLIRHYKAGAPTTRDAMEEAGLCTQTEWNLVNQTMKAISLKKNNKMRGDLDFGVAVSEWWANVDMREDGYVWTQNGKGQWKALVELK